MAALRKLSLRALLASTFALIVATWCGAAAAAQLTLTWVDSGNDESGFFVERGTNAAGPFTEVGTTGAGVSSYTDSTVVPGTAYCYRVAAYNAAGSSGYTNVACATAGQMFGLAVVKMGAGSGTVTGSPSGILCGNSCSGSYPGGSTVTLTAAASSGSTFSGWSGGNCTGTGSCGVTLGGPTTITATFALQTAALTVSKSGTGGGTITSAPAGIQCGGTCSAQFAKGASVTLTAVPASGSSFAGWSGGGCSGTGGCSLNLNTATTVTGAFALIPEPPPSDTTPPVVAILSPDAGSTVSGIATVNVSASDETGVTGLSYFLDGKLLGTASPSSSSYSWDSTKTSNGPHTLAVTAVDAAGNKGQSSVSIVVDNALGTASSIDAPPVVSGADGIVTVSVSSGSGTPTGVVSLVVNGGSARTATLAEGRAQFTVPTPSVGDHTLKATYAPQGSYGGSSATGMLRVRDTPTSVAQLSFSRDAYSGRPVKSSVAVTVVRSGSTRSSATVHYATSDGTATAGVHYRATSGTLRFWPGVTKRTFYVSILRSSLTAPVTINLALSDPSSGAEVGDPSAAVLTLATSRSASSGALAATSGFEVEADGDDVQNVSADDGEMDGHEAPVR